MRRTIMSLMLSVLVCVGWGQTYRYRYWIDNNVNGAVSGSASGEKQFNVNISSLGSGLHALHMQAQNARGVWSSVYSRHFIKNDHTNATTARYWFDNDLSTEHKEATTTGIIDLDISSLKAGLHCVHFQTFTSQGIPSSVRTRFFVLNNPVVATNARYWFDNDMTTIHEDVATSGIVELDITHLTVGLHSVHYQTFDSEGIPSTIRTRYFIVDQIQIATLLARIWIDDGKPADYELSNDEIVIEVSDLSYGIHDLHVALVDIDGRLIDQLTQKFEKKAPTVTIALSSYGESTYCYGHDLDFSQTNDIKAYIASGYYPQTGYVLLTRVLEVPAGTGIVVRGEEGTYKVPYGESSAYYLNLLVGNVEPITVEPTEGEYANLYLTEGNSGLGFYPVTTPFVMDANRARLQLPTSLVSSESGVKIFYEEDTDAIHDVLGTSDTFVYDLSGRKVTDGKQLKGIFIRNGKKILIK